ncbi:MULTISPECIES: heavy-metal-associated domain-containing protein [Mycobacteriaceae]|uniref:heavy-metal-associated domain-containing protein n=1 Tax=Mycobacteriaceae TaxID=1762 RepID=UPI001CD9A51E|nr:heavy-metal-associated domain-containing protein [Mycobacterium sp. WUMAC-067]MCA2243412.1 heavy-metal-associated domain-containing protein [Mycobacterium sp. WUMAC-067]
MVTSEFVVTGMTCGHCAASVREEVAKIAGVEDIDVDVASGKLVVVSSGPIADPAVLGAVEEAGYTASRADQSSAGQHGASGGCCG